MYRISLKYFYAKQSKIVSDRYANVSFILSILGKSFDITYIRVVFRSPRPESFSIYKRVSQSGPWVPYQFYSATCRDTYRLPDSRSIKLGDDESRALCTSEYSEISPLRDGNVAFSSLEGRPSGHKFEDSDVLHVSFFFCIHLLPFSHTHSQTSTHIELGNCN